MNLNYYLYGEDRLFNIDFFKDKYLNGYIYYYDNNKIFTISLKQIKIHKYSVIKITPEMKIQNKEDFKIIKNKYIILDFNDYLMIDTYTGKYIGIIKNIYEIPLQKRYSNYKIEKYTGGKLDGYLYYRDFYNKEAPEENLIKIEEKLSENNDNYFTTDDIEISEYPFININNNFNKIEYSDKIIIEDQEILDILYNNSVSFIRSDN